MQRELSGVMAERSRRRFRNTAAAFAEEQADRRPGDREIDDLGDRTDRGKARLHIAPEDALLLTLLDHAAEPLEHARRELQQGGFGTAGFVIDQLADQEPRRVRMPQHELELRRDEGPDRFGWCG